MFKELLEKTQKLNESYPVYSITFPDMEQDEELVHSDFGGIYQEDTFEAHFEDGFWITYIDAADESFEANTLEDLAKQIQQFLSSDSAMIEVGDYNINKEANDINEEENEEEEEVNELKDVRLTIDGDEIVIGMHDSYLIFEALRYYKKDQLTTDQNSLDNRDVNKLMNIFQKLAW